MYRYTQNQDVIRLLLLLKTSEQDYPVPMMTLQEFAVILLVGLFSGTYSSIFIAASILVVWENREWQNWFRKPKESQA